MNKIYSCTVFCNNPVYRFYFNKNGKYIFGYCLKHFFFARNVPDCCFLLPRKIRSMKDLEKYLIMV